MTFQDHHWAVAWHVADQWKSGARVGEISRALGMRPRLVRNVLRFLRDRQIARCEGWGGGARWKVDVALLGKFAAGVQK